MPPICEITGERLEEGQGGLVTFARTESDERWYARAEGEEGFVGHPPNAVWLSSPYYERAQELTGLTWEAARRRLV